MTEKEFEGLFKESPELTPRAELKNEILARAQKELEQKSSDTTVTEIKPKPSHFKRLKIWMPIAACLVLAVLVFGGVRGLNNEEYQTIYIDVNPSVALMLNRFDNVSGVEYLNEDARRALEGVDLNGLDAEVALERVVDALDSQGYFENEAVLCISGDENSQELIGRLKNHAERIKGDKKYTVSTQAISQNEKEEAKDMGISPGKYRVIKQIMEISSQYTFEELKELPMYELNKLYKELKNRK